jgi:hypothetical protein
LEHTAKRPRVEGRAAEAGAAAGIAGSPPGASVSTSSAASSMKGLLFAFEQNQVHIRSDFAEIIGWQKEEGNQS